MFPYNIVEDQAKELIHACAEKSIGFIAMKPLAGGAIEDAVTALRCVWRQPGCHCGDTWHGGHCRAEPESRRSKRIVPRCPWRKKPRWRAIRDALVPSSAGRCNLCQPCSAGISISSVFLFEGYLSRYGAGGLGEKPLCNAYQKGIGVHRLRRLRKPLPLPSAHPWYAERSCGKVRRIKENIHEAVNCAPRRPGLFHRLPDRDRLDRSGAAVRPPCANWM